MKITFSLILYGLLSGVRRAITRWMRRLRIEVQKEEKQEDAHKELQG